MLLSELPVPSVIEVLDFETIVNRKKTRLKGLLAEKGVAWVDHPSDDFTTLIELDAYDELLLRTRINEAVRQQLLAFATAENLDHVATKYGEVRLEGSKPYARFVFHASVPILSVSSGMVLSDGGMMTGRLVDDVEIEDYQGVGIVELDAYVVESDVQLSSIVTPLPYLVKAEQLERFGNGAESESDDNFRERIWLSRDKKTTAGSANMYRYYVRSADSRIREVKVCDDDGRVDIYFAFENRAGDDVAKERIETLLSKEENYPLSDTPTVHIAEAFEVPIKAHIKLFNPSLFPQTDAKIRAAVAAYSGAFDKDISISKIYELLGDPNIENIELITPQSNAVCIENRFLRLSLELSYA